MLDLLRLAISVTLTFGQWLLLRRRELKLSQQAIADRLEVSRQTVSNWETGASVPALNVWQFQALGELLQCSLDAIPSDRP